MNLTELARLAGVSVSTASKSFSGSKEISDETRKRIFDLAREHGCFDKYNKNKFEKRVIAVICPEIISEYYSAITEALMNEISNYDAIVTVSVTNFKRSLEQKLYTYYSSYCKADGIILLDPRSRINNHDNVPTVSLSHGKMIDNVDSISTNYQRSITDAVSYLKSLGHTQIGFAGETLTLSKMEMFKNALRSVGLPINDTHISISGERFEKAGADIAKRWISDGNMPTSVITAYDYIAIGMIKELRLEGYRIPEDLSLIGMDDIARAPYLETSLSSIHFPKEEMCKIAVELIMKKIDNPYYSSRQSITIPTQFIPRESAAKPREA